MEEESVDLNEVKLFFNPHPGFAGAAIPIPSAVKAVADELDGQRMPLREAVNKIQAVTTGKVKAVPKYSYIGLDIADSSARHFFNVINYV